MHRISTRSMTVTAIGSICLVLASCTKTPTAGPDPVNCPEPVQITQNLGADTTWDNIIEPASCVDYVVTRALNNADYALVIEPGVIVAFEADAGLRLQHQGSLSAIGTSEEPIVLTGTVRTRGHWLGVTFLDSNSPENRLAFVTIEYAGALENTVDGVASALTVVHNTGTSSVSVEDSTIRESEGYGMFVRLTSELTSFARNTLTANALGPAYVYASVAHDLSPTSSYTGNDLDFISVRPNSIESTMDVAWSALDVPYRLLQDRNREGFSIEGGLVLAPGVTIEFEEDMAMYVRSSGTLTAVGTAAAPISLTGTVETPGHWRGLAYSNTPNVLNRLEHVTIEYGGRAPIGISEPANLAVTQNGGGTQVTIRNVTLRFGAGYGLYARFNTILDDFVGNTLIGNALGAAHVDISVAHFLTEGSTYVGNTTDRVALAVEREIASSVTWKDLGVPFVVLEALNTEGFRVMGVAGALTIDPGIEIQFGPDMALTIRDGGTLTAVGTPENPILLGPESTPWKGVDLWDSTGFFGYVTIADSGSSAFGLVDKPGAVTIRETQGAARANFSEGTSYSGPAHGAVFGYGQTTAIQCGYMMPVYVPPPDSEDQHCL